ncbi:hypothetical protein M595_4784 [Lyngbya aestuarii BL J]|uniref:Uncharacterized protein n=1 Tax=Lyngbya aestuarii BL J TaxID=1348334 RepID=U7QE18_9CYAN|nr:hypothetical protein [Lyngbya aestuarii]ERT05285.1 hypothetical protein M595_4784 [Lyngbya aestuarii BL J]
MSLPSVLNIALGLFFVYLLLSLLVSDLQELLSTLFWDSRAKSLYSSIHSIVGEKMAESLYDHPLIKSLKDYKSEQGKNFVGPSYIPKNIFAFALIDSLLEKYSVDSRIVDLQSEQFIEAIESSQIKAILSRDQIKLFKVLAVQAHLKQDKHDSYIKALEAEIMNWFSQAMDRTSGVYKRQVKWKTLLFGFLFAVILNADTFNIASRLYKEPFLQYQLSQEVNQFYEIQTSLSADESVEPSQDSSDLTQDLTQLIIDFSSLPLGWNQENINEQFNLKPENSTSEREVRGSQISFVIAQAILGWILTAIAISMGASFWFDLLNKLINVRNTGSQ